MQPTHGQPILQLGLYTACERFEVRQRQRRGFLLLEYTVQLCKAPCNEAAHAVRVVLEEDGHRLDHCGADAGAALGMVGLCGEKKWFEPLSSYANPLRFDILDWFCLLRKVGPLAWYVCVERTTVL
jgi:hypothetical protein